MSITRKKQENALEPYVTPEELETFISEFSDVKLKKGVIKSIALDGKLLNEDGKVGVYEMLAFMAMYVK